MSADVRNNPLRQLVGNPLETTVDFIDRKLPWVTPNLVTLASTAGMLALDYLVVRYPDHGFPIGVAQTGTVLGDLVDGGLARKKAARESGSTTVFGQLLDSLSDKAQEVAQGVALSRRAANQGDRLGTILHLSSGVTAPLPALARANAERHDIVVDETGGKFGGSRPMRATLGIVSVALLHNRPRTAHAVSALMTAQNIATALQRRQAVKPGSRYALGALGDPEQIAASAQRYRTLQVASVLAGGIGVGLMALDAKNAHRAGNDQRQGKHRDQGLGGHQGLGLQGDRTGISRGKIDSIGD